jgi:hypothetical protein
MKYYLRLNFKGSVISHVRSRRDEVQRIRNDLGSPKLFEGLQFYGDAASTTARLIRISGWPDIESVRGDKLLIADNEILELAQRVLTIDFLYGNVSFAVTGPDGDSGPLAELSALFERMISVAQAHSLELALWSGVRVVDVDFVRPVPPRDLGPIHKDGLLEAVNTQQLEEFPRLHSLREALSQQLPANVSVRSLPPYVIANWAGSAGADRGAIEAALSARLEWYYSHGNLEVLDGYNELGDSLVVLFNPSKDPFYTFYVPFNNTAYKALAGIAGQLEEDGNVRAMLRDLSRGKTKKGRELSALFLIFPSRDEALKHRASARALGFADNAYPTSDGKLWIPSDHPATPPAGDA